MTDIVVKITVELLSVLALATKQIKQGRFSKWLSHVHFRGLMYRREICEEIAGRQRNRDSSPEIRSIDRERGSDDRRTDYGRRLWPCR